MDSFFEYLTWIFGAFVFTVSLFLLFIKKKEAHKKKEQKDSRSYLTPNATNYNIASAAGRPYRDVTPAEAKEIIKKHKLGNLPSLSNEDFYDLKAALKGQSAA